MGIAFLSDRLQMRAIFCIIFGAVSVVGYGVLLSDSSAGVHYFGYGNCGISPMKSTNSLKLFPRRHWVICYRWLALSLG